MTDNDPSAIHTSSLSLSKKYMSITSLDTGILESNSGSLRESVVTGDLDEYSQRTTELFYYMISRGSYSGGIFKLKYTPILSHPLDFRPNLLQHARTFQYKQLQRA